MAAKIEGLSRATFSELAPILADFGYHVVPIRPGSKAPEGIAGWQTPRAPDYYLPRHGDWATGILTATSPAIDLDIRDRGIVKMLIRLAEEVLERGPSPIRVGQPPKALLPFSTDEPFDKVMSRWFALPGEDFTAVGFKAHRVEVLGDGQQFVAFGRHPRGSYYRWVRGSLLTYHAVDLAPIDQPQAQAFVDAAENIMLAAGMIPLVLQGGRYRLDLPRATPPTPPPRRRPLQAPETVPSWQFMSIPRPPGALPTAPGGSVAPCTEVITATASRSPAAATRPSSGNASPTAHNAKLRPVSPRSSDEPRPRRC